MSLELFERPGYGERAVLVSVDFGEEHEVLLREFEELATSSGAQPVATVTTVRTSPDARYFVGSGKAVEIQATVKGSNAEIVLFNHELTPSQQRNLEKLIECRVIDRTDLILDIFAQRARSYEGKLQVELAQLKHLSTRLIRGWTHLERQKGGIGLRGPGETQLETDRRLIGKRIALLQKRLDKVDKQRHQSRRSRVRAEVPTVSLVGYTNAGKSSLFNRLTGAEVYAEDQLFATLDPTLRRIELSGVGDVVLADTVGFIRNLPHDLVAAFKSTLQETLEADLLLHVVDVHDEEHPFRIQQVNEVLQAIGADSVPQIVVYNKIDLNEQGPSMVKAGDGNISSVALSAASGDGLDLLTAALVNYFQADCVEGSITLAPSEQRTRASLYSNAEIIKEHKHQDGGCTLHIRILQHKLDELGISSSRLLKDSSDVAGVA